VNTAKELRAALADEVRRLQPPAGLETRVLQQALGVPAIHQARRGGSRGVVSRWESRPGTHVAWGARTAGAVAVVLIAILLVVGILVGGRVLRDWQTVPTHPSTHAVPRADSGMVTSTAGWRIDTGPVQRTTDGGAHWTNVEPRSVVNSASDTAYFLDATHAWVTEIDGSGPSSLTTYRTVDGAKTWQQSAAIAFAGAVELSGLYFVDSTHGWLTGAIFVPPSDSPNSVGMSQQKIYGTNDGGLHWAFLFTSLITSEKNPGCQWGGVAFTSLRDGWLALDCPSSNTSPLLATHDGGMTWTPQQLPLAEAGLSCPCTAGTPMVFDHTSAAIELGPWLGHVHSNYVLQGNSGSGPAQRLFMTADNGKSWTARSLPGEFQFVVDFIDAKHGWTVAGPGALFTRDSSGTFPTHPGVTVPLYRTNDGGLTWAPVETNLALSDSNGRLTNLYFVDLQHGFAERYNTAAIGREYRQFLGTDDGGRTWKVVWTFA
jgi:photosystem II stability/assembly factor-like uncharacterized protein